MYCHARVTVIPALMFKHLDGLYNICGRDKQCIVRKLAGTLSPERSRCKWKDNIKMDLKNRVCVDSSGEGYGPVVDSWEHRNEPSGSTLGEEFD